MNSFTSPNPDPHSGASNVALAGYVARPRIGIITGSGPEAGLDLWTKVLRENRRRMGSQFRHDTDAPAVDIISDPALGLSMELDHTEQEVWTALRADAEALDGRVAAYAIACNTLNVFAPRLNELGLTARLISFADVLAAHLRRRGDTRVCLLGARTVAELGAWSPYRSLRSVVDFEPLDEDGRMALHQLIYDVKQYGSHHPDLRERFVRLLDRVRSDTVLLACTELPLIADVETSKHLVDVTQLVAEALVDCTGLAATPGGA
ncbi:aspartate/glutamate racemase family protein [Bradyrhizobium stylosanthis]|nr:aspartate/glutamate racemase family protein [Bradyrhizobium stylosanthis]